MYSILLITILLSVTKLAKHTSLLPFPLDIFTQAVCPWSVSLIFMFCTLTDPGAKSLFSLASCRTKPNLPTAPPLCSDLLYVYKLSLLYRCSLNPLSLGAEAVLRCERSATGCCYIPCVQCARGQLRSSWGAGSSQLFPCSS